MKYLLKSLIFRLGCSKREIHPSRFDANPEDFIYLYHNKDRGAMVQGSVMTAIRKSEIAYITVPTESDIIVHKLNPENPGTRIGLKNGHTFVWPDVPAYWHKNLIGDR